MSLSDLDVAEVYEGDGIATDFPITADIEDKTVVVVTLIDETTEDSTTRSGLAETVRVESTHFDFDAATPPTQVEMYVAPTATEKLRVERVTPLTQDDVYSAGEDNNNNIEENLDKVFRILQELDYKVSDNFTKIIADAVSSSTAGTIPDWATATNYNESQVVLNNEKLYRALSDHLSGTFSDDLIAGKWELLEVAGVKGDTGDQGVAGADGADSVVAGPAGANGADGADGIFSAIATQGEAETGTDNTKGMSPLRVAQAISSQVDEAQIVTNQTDIATVTALANNINGRLTAVEAMVQQATGKFAGQQNIKNNAGPIQLVGEGATGADSYGYEMSRNSDGTEFAMIDIFIRRQTDTELRVSYVKLIMQFIDDEWLIGRADTMQLDETLELDGITFSVVNTVTGASVDGEIYYASDNMAGTNHDTQSLISWLGQEISKV